MKKISQISVVDLGSSKITCVIATRSEDNTSLRVVGVASIPSKGIRKSQIVDIEDSIEAVTESVESAERMAGLSIKGVSVSVSGIHIESQNSKGLVAVQNPDDEIISADLDRVVEAAKAVPLPTQREILHVIPRYFLVDNQEGIKDPVGMSGVRLEVEAHLITGSSVNLKNLSRVMSEIGVDTQTVTFAGLASSVATLTETEKELGAVMVDIGGGTSSLCVYIDGALSHSAVIPVGAKNITNDIAIGLRVSLDTAEVIKRNLSVDEHIAKALDPKNPGSKKQADEIDLSKLGLKDAPRKISRKAVVEGIVRPRLNEIFELIKIELIKAGMGGKTPAGLVLTGGGAMTYGLAETARKILNMQARIATPTGLTGLIDEIKTPEYATVVGLLLLSDKVDSTPSKSGFQFPKLGFKLPTSNIVKKVVDFIKSFLP
ncbi:cell division protein FtsA [Candidatus Collierbacteria bacterium CG10_big_fil_rev_8_21_14_0_10_44_9]|uniref:Cell division protein FtsA n=1 Tax=Candidatus Collierbacteria bacterium CG10_big_fil_rev_8_21_14_0_10_44_9 TaxID=1974535 RepID=A0A2H0VI39_9BACT|nr:MAG: cell division protein FtsA [Candidatus Collierbacteria bacterium CG10_big_fil_rev_8_21_14_0_10_44_9]